MRVVITYFDAGGGHRAAAQALQAILSSDERCRVDLLNLQEYLDALDPARRLLGVRIQEVYNRMLNRGSTRLMKRLLPILHTAVRIYTPLIANRLAAYWAESRPDVVVSVVPNLNRAIAVSVTKAIPGTPFVTVLTDFADTPPHFWVEKESEYIVCGTERAAEQALAMGHSPTRVFRTSGMVLHPRFYSLTAPDATQLRPMLGLDPALPTLLVMFGGQGSREMLKIAEGLNDCTNPIQAVFICGHNKALRKELETLDLHYRRVVTGFTSEVPAYMAAADLVIGKPGPGSVSEALHFGLPVVVTRNASTMPQEVYNTYWIEERGVGLVLRDFDSLAKEIDLILNTDKLGQMKAAARECPNRAIFEIPEIIRKVLDYSAAKARAVNEAIAS
jgi:1,2-diacylglycerol 3-beta-galactosyltransferase